MKTTKTNIDLFKNAWILKMFNFVELGKKIFNSTEKCIGLKDCTWIFIKNSNLLSAIEIFSQELNVWTYSIKRQT